MIAIVARRPARDAALPERALPYLKGGASILQQILAADPWHSSSPPDRPAMHRPTPMSWPACAVPDGEVARAPDRT